MPPVYIGIDDTDIAGSPGTNQLARRLADSLPDGCRTTLILRHQLLLDPRVPFTSQNGSASLLIESEDADPEARMLPTLRREIQAWFVSGSDPGLCTATNVHPAVIEFGRRCQRELVTQAEARYLAERSGIRLEGLGGTEDGVIGALAAVGLLASGNDGRVVHRPGWTWPDSFAGAHPIDAILTRGVDEVRDSRSGERLVRGSVDVGKHLRPALRAGRVVLFVEPANGSAGDAAAWRAIKLP
jgi:hypothetical protein